MMASRQLWKYLVTPMALSGMLSISSAAELNLAAATSTDAEEK